MYTASVQAASATINSRCIILRSPPMQHTIRYRGCLQPPRYRMRRALMVLRQRFGRREKAEDAGGIFGAAWLVSGHSTFPGCMSIVLDSCDVPVNALAQNSLTVRQRCTHAH